MYNIFIIYNIYDIFLNICYIYKMKIIYIQIYYIYTLIICILAFISTIHAVPP